MSRSFLLSRTKSNLRELSSSLSELSSELLEFAESLLSEVDKAHYVSFSPEKHIRRAFHPTPQAFKQDQKSSTQTNKQSSIWAPQSLSLLIDYNPLDTPANSSSSETYHERKYLPPFGWKPVMGFDSDVKLKYARNCDRNVFSVIL